MAGRSAGVYCCRQACTAVGLRELPLLVSNTALTVSTHTALPELLVWHEASDCQHLLLIQPAVLVPSNAVFVVPSHLCQGGETPSLDPPLAPRPRSITARVQVVVQSEGSMAPVGYLHPLAFHVEPKQAAPKSADGEKWVDAGLMLTVGLPLG